MNDIDAVLRDRLSRRDEAGLLRRRREVVGPHRSALTVDGREGLSFCSNDYLGLAADPRIIAAFRDGLTSCGAGSGASQLVSGHNQAHRRLEDALAEFTGRERALLFATGYMANVGTIAGLLGKQDRLIADALNHASLIDGARLSGAQRVVVSHSDPAAVRQALSESFDGHSMVVSDAVFSMDGDVAPLAELARVSRDGNAWLMVDDAHGFGVLGPNGAGAVAEAGLTQADVPVLVATLGKSVGVFGAFVAGSEALIESLLQAARSVIYTTAPPPAMAVAALTGLKLVKEEGWRRAALFERVEQFREGAKRIGIRLGDSRTAIQPLIVGQPEVAMALSDALLEQGVLVTAIRPPTVPAGSSRLRITFSATHSAADVERLLAALAGAGETLGILQ